MNKYKRNWQRDWKLLNAFLSEEETNPDFPEFAANALPHYMQRVREYRRILEYAVDCLDFCPVCGEDKPQHKAGCELSVLLREPM